MPERFSQRILQHLSDQRYVPRTVHQLADDLGIGDDQRELFGKAVSDLLEEGQVILGSTSTIVLPPPGRIMEGLFRRHERGFGFVIPDAATQHGDLFIPPGDTNDALTGDRVRAKVFHQPRRGRAIGKSPYVGRIEQIIQRADKQYVGQLIKKGSTFLVQVDGKVLHEPVVIRDPHAKNASVGDKVVIELIEYPDSETDKPGQGVITEVLGEAGEPDVETLSVMRAYSLREKFTHEQLEHARKAAHDFHDDQVPPDRVDLTELFSFTIDPPDARDFDDAISLRRLDEQPDAPCPFLEKAPRGAAWELGVHIADVSHFVRPGDALDAEAYDRGNSTYLPRRVIPMLPELLSNGVCSLQEGVNRLTKSAFIYYDKSGKVMGQRFARSVIRSAKRLTYLEAQALIEGDLREARKHAKAEAKYPKALNRALKQADELARTIRQRRFKDGMIVLDLPEVELVFDESGRVVDAQPEDDAFTHTIIEMFMVEANEAAARTFDNLGVPMIRRVHPDPDAYDVGELKQFARVAGFNIPANPSRKQLQQLLEKVRGKPAQQAVHLAVLRTLSKAEYSPLIIGHFALASEHYTHFTSPIRRYPDLIVHRGLDAYIDALNNNDPGPAKGGKRNKLARHVAGNDDVPAEQRLFEIGRHCSTRERNSESAERELRDYLVMELLSENLGDDYQGTVTGVTSTGVFIELNRYLVDGMVRASDLPGAQGERWRLNPNTGALVADRSGRTIAIGDQFTVRIANVDLARRQMELVVVESDDAPPGQKKKQKKTGKSSKTGKPPRKQSPGAAKAHEKTRKLKEQSKDRNQNRGKKKSTKKRGRRR